MKVARPGGGATPVSSSSYMYRVTKVKVQVRQCFLSLNPFDVVNGML